MSGLRVALAALLLICSSACGGPSVEDRQREAQAALDKGDFAAALTSVDTALKDAQISGDPAKAWRFEVIRLDALARSGKGDDVLDAIDRLKGTYPTQITAALYRSLADKLRAAKDTMGAVGVLDAGNRAFPAEQESFVKAIDEIKAAGLDPETEAMLEKLGYL